METAIKTVLEMLVQRGYEITNNDEDNIIGINSEGKQIVIFTIPVSKFNVDRVKEYVSLLYKINIHHCIVIYSDTVTSMAKKLVTNSLDIEMEIFTLSELQYNITKHRLVPQHIKLPDDEAKEFKKKYGVKFPTILKTDPVSRFYNFQRGDIIKIVRKVDGNDFTTHRLVKG